MTEEKSLSNTLDHIQRVSRNERSSPLSDDERSKIASDAEAKALTRDPAADRARRAWAKRAGFVKAVLNVQAEAMQHGETYDAQDRAEIVADISLGEVPAAAKARVPQFVATAAGAIADGDKAAGLRDAEEAAVDVANELRGHWTPPAPPSPADLADLIPRS